MIKALPEAISIWNDPYTMLDEWTRSKSKQAHEQLVASWVGEAGSVVDLGCGAGRYAHILQYAKYTGFDGSSPMIMAAKENRPARAEFAAVDIFGYVSSNTYNTAIMIDVAQHQEDPIGAIESMLELWVADWYIFSLLVGDKQERLLNSVVVPLSALFPILNSCELIRMRIEPSPDGSQFGWCLIEVTKLGPE